MPKMIVKPKRYSDFRRYHMMGIEDQFPPKYGPGFKNGFVIPAGGGMLGGGAAAAPACNTTVDSITAASWDQNLIGGAGGTLIIGEKFTAGTPSYTVCKVVCRLQRKGTTLTGNLRAYIYTDNSNKPGTLIGTGSDAVPVGDVTQDADDEQPFVNMSAAVTAGTAYWVLVYFDGTPIDNTHCIQWRIINGSGNHAMRTIDYPATTWYELDTYGQIFTTYK